MRHGLDSSPATTCVCINSLNCSLNLWEAGQSAERRDRGGSLECPYSNTFLLPFLIQVQAKPIDYTPLSRCNASYYRYLESAGGLWAPAWALMNEYSNAHRHLYGHLGVWRCSCKCTLCSWMQVKLKFWLLPLKTTVILLSTALINLRYTIFEPSKMLLLGS